MRRKWVIGVEQRDMSAQPSQPTKCFRHEQFAVCHEDEVGSVLRRHADNEIVLRAGAKAPEPQTPDCEAVHYSVAQPPAQVVSRV